MSIRAVFGGSFDPPHVGHVMLVSWVLAAHEIDELLIIPTWKHAFRKTPGAGFTHRVEMCERTFDGTASVTVSTIERELGDVSRTLHTLQALRESYPKDSLRLVVGADVLPNTNRWYKWDEIIAIAPPIAVGRAGYALPDGCPIEIPNVSSTEIRRRLAADEDVSGLVPHRVVSYIADHDLYRKDE